MSETSQGPRRVLTILSWKMGRPALLQPKRQPSQGRQLMLLNRKRPENRGSRQIFCPTPPVRAKFFRHVSELWTCSIQWVTVERGIKFGIDQNRDAAANCWRLAPVTHAGRAASSPEIFRPFLTVCLTVFPFEFRPRTFTIGFYRKKSFISELMILECSFPLTQHAGNNSSNRNHYYERWHCLRVRCFEWWQIITSLTPPSFCSYSFPHSILWEIAVFILHFVKRTMWPKDLWRTLKTYSNFC